LDLAVHALEEALMIDSGEAQVHYALACYWSLGNSPKMAVAYLAKALDIDPGIRDRIAGESDFDPIRRHPDFSALIRVAA